MVSAHYRGRADCINAVTIGDTRPVNRTAQGFQGCLQKGERITWADRPRQPRLMRLLGLPPRGTAQLFAHALALTLLLGLVVAGAAEQDPGLIAAGAVPLVAVGALWSWSTRRSARTAYALSDRGRGFLRRGDEVWVFHAPPAAIAVCDAGQEVGNLILGELDVLVVCQRGFPSVGEASPFLALVAGEQRRAVVRFRDVAYPGSVLDLLSPEKSR